MGSIKKYMSVQIYSTEIRQKYDIPTRDAPCITEKEKETTERYRRSFY